MDKAIAKAEKAAKENKKTWGELRDIILNADKSGMSVLNKSLTKEKVGVLFLDMIKHEKDPVKVPVGLELPTIANILREFAPQ